MLRGILVCAMVAATACGKASDGGATGSAVVPGAKAGTVVELAGTVTAVRDGKSRPLATAAEVSGDDRIATGADSRVVIELAHNGARWSLGANKAGVVSESVAWTLPQASGSARANETDMTAGGRHAEKSAADTAATGKDQPPPPPAPAAAVAPIAPGANAPPAAQLERAAATAAPKAAVTTAAPKRLAAAEPADDRVEAEKADVPAAATPEAFSRLVLGDAAVRACVRGGPARTLALHCTAGKCAAKVASASTPCLDKAIAQLHPPPGTFDISVEVAP